VDFSVAETMAVMLFRSGMGVFFRVGQVHAEGGVDNSF
jgi:hypothetical protein